jgi:single-strand DNA-binding protein
MLNQIVLMGRLTKDPELRSTPAGVSVVSFSLAVERDFASREEGGEKQTDFIDVVAWRNTAEFVSKYFFKGQLAAVSGRLQIRNWTDKEGVKRKNAEVVADNVYFAEGKRNREDGAAPYQKTGNFSAPASFNTDSSGFAALDDDDGDLPF